MARTAQLYSIIDLFSGVGGLSLGATRAGFRVDLAMELDAQIAGVHHVNFPSVKNVLGDIARVRGADILKLLPSGVRTLGGVVGGPPCQGFSEIGKRVAEDPRNNLFGHFFRIVAELRPAFFLAENVPGILAERNRGVVQRALNQLPGFYKILSPTLITATDFGAATTRRRVFFFGYDPSRVRGLTEDELFRPAEIVAPTVGEALAGLPVVRSDWQYESQGWRKLSSTPEGDFYSKLFSHVPLGVGCEHALRRLASDKVVSGCLGTRHSDETVRRFRRLKPGAVDSVSKARRLDPAGYCPTLRAGTGTDRGSYQAVRPIHPSSHRVITPREAARLQGFPDWFQFHGAKWHAFRQIGNSVSPLVAEEILRRIIRNLDR